MAAEKKHCGLAYIEAMKAILDRMSSEDLFEGFEMNTEHGCIENSLRKMEEELRKKQ